MRVHLCVCVCVCARAHMCAFRMVSMGKILCFTNTSVMTIFDQFRVPLGWKQAMGATERRL